MHCIKFQIINKTDMLEKSKIHLVSFLRTKEPMRFLKAPSAKNWHTHTKKIVDLLFSKGINALQQSSRLVFML